MNDMDTQVRESLEAVGGATPVPRFDEVAFRAKVRAARLRRGALAVVGSAAAVGVLAVSAYAVGAVVDGGHDGDARAPRVATQPDRGEVLRPSPLLTQPIYFTSGMRLRALAPDGTVHDLGLESEAVVGFTQEGVYAFDDESRLVWFSAETSGEGDGRYTFVRGETPVDGAVQSAALSGDGRYLAWLGPDDVVTAYDLKAGESMLTTLVDSNAYVTSVSSRGVLVSEGGDLRLYEREGIVEVPTAQDGYGWQSDVAGDRVSVMDRDGVTRVYDVSSGEAELEVEVPGSGRLAPYGAAVVTAHLGGPAARLWVDDGLEPLRAPGMKQSAGWLDEDHAVLTSVVDGKTVVQVCAVSTRECDDVLTTAEDVRLAE